MHYSGGSWTAVDPPNMAGYDLSDISMVSASSGWIAAGEKAFQYDGTTWNERSTGLGSNLHVDRISAVGANDVWGVSSYNYPCDPCTPTIVHWDGTIWRDQDPLHTITPFDISMLSATDGWVLGIDSTSGGVIAHYDGTGWTPIAIPFAPGANLA